MSLESPSFIIRTKLICPQTPGDFVPRTELIEYLNQQSQRPLTIISAPAGYGKSTLASSWVQSLSKPYGWLSLDEHDDDLTLFINYFVAALQTLFPDIGHEVLQLTKTASNPSIRMLAGSLLNDLNEISTPFMLVLDDYHLIRKTAIHDFLIELLCYPPSSIHIILCTRQDPPLPIISMQAQSLVLTVRGRDLSFSTQETAVFLQKTVKIPLTNNTISHLAKLTEGWITGLRLVALSLRTQEEPADFVANLSQNPYQITKYLVEEVLAQLEPDKKDFLLKTSVLNRFCDSLCLAVTQSNKEDNYDSTSYLGWLQDANLFLIPLDNQRTWFRYHHLFQQHLQQQAELYFPPEEITQLHQRASKWFAEHNYIDEALHHALAGNDIETAVSLIAEDRHTLIDQEQFHHLGQRLKMFDPQTVAQYPQLQIIKAWLLNINARYDEEIAVLDAVEKQLKEISLPPHISQPIYGEIHAFRTDIADIYANGLEMLTHADQALALLPENWHYVYSAIQALKASGLALTGQVDQAEAYIQARLVNPDSQNLRYRLLLLFGLITTHWLQLDLYQMRVVSTQFLQLSQKYNLPQAIGFANYFLGCIHYQQNQLDKAKTNFTTFANINTPVGLNFQLNSICCLVLTYLAEGNPNKASTQLDIGNRLLTDRNNRALLPYLEGSQAEIALHQGDLPSAIRWANSYDPYQFSRYRLLYQPQITWIKTKLAQNTSSSLESCAAFVFHFMKLLRESHLHHLILSCLPLNALLSQQLGKQDLAVAQMKEAVHLAKKAGSVRFIADVGLSIKPLLEDLQQKGIAPFFIDDILLALPSTSTTNHNTTVHMKKRADLPIQLTNREMQILELLAKRFTNKEIAEELFISPGTVSQHNNRIYKKLDVSSRQDAVVKAKQLNLLPFIH